MHAFAQTFLGYGVRHTYTCTFFTEYSKDENGLQWPITIDAYPWNTLGGIGTYVLTPYPSVMVII